VARTAVRRPGIGGCADRRARWPMVTPRGNRRGSPRRLARRHRSLPAVGPVHVVVGQVLVAAEDLALPGRWPTGGWARRGVRRGAAAMMRSGQSSGWLLRLGGGRCRMARRLGAGRLTRSQVPEWQASPGGTAPDRPEAHDARPAWHPGRADNPERPDRSAMARYRRQQNRPSSAGSYSAVGLGSLRSGVVVLSIVVSPGRAALVHDELPVATWPRTHALGKPVSGLVP
jgi:hypothetical protein